MIFSNERPRRRWKSTRLGGFDYTQPAAYFVTLRAFEGKCIFGDVWNGKTRLNGFGRIVEEE